MSFSQIKGAVTGAFGRKSKSVAVLLTGLAASASASAALPSEIAAAFTALTTDFTDMSSLAWPVIATIVGGFALVTLFKRFVSKSL